MASTRLQTIRWKRVQRRIGVLLGFVPGQKTTGYDYLRIAMGCLLLIASGLKTHQLMTEPILGHSIFDSRWVLIAAVEFEIFFGLWLLRGLLPRLTWMAALGCFGVFACVSLYKALAGEASCGCFGKIEVNPWITLSIDTAAIAVFSILRPQYNKYNNRLLPMIRLGSLTSLLCALLPLAVISGWLAIAHSNSVLYKSGLIISGDAVILDPSRWIGKKFPLTNHIVKGQLIRNGRTEQFLSGELAYGKWLIVLYHSDCPKCRATINSLRQSSENTRIVLLELPPYGVADSSLTKEFVHCQLDETSRWISSDQHIITLLDEYVADST